MSVIEGEREGWIAEKLTELSGEPVTSRHEPHDRYVIVFRGRFCGEHGPLCEIEVSQMMLLNWSESGIEGHLSIKLARLREWMSMQFFPQAFWDPTHPYNHQDSE